MKKDLFNTFKVARLLAKDLAGCLDGEERRMLDDWLAEEASHRKFYAEMRMEAEQGMPARRYSDAEVERQLRLLYRRRERRMRRLSGWWRYAAGVALAAGVAGWIYWQMGNGAVEEAGMPVIDGQKGVTLVLADGEQMVLSDTLTRRDAEGRVVFRADGQSVAYGGDSVAVEVEGWNTLTVPKGMEFRAELADGSVVWLNAESELRYPARFSGERREVQLKGEGYFDVARREGQAFVVRAGDVDVEVYGTEFNVEAYSEERVRTVLVEGSVGVRVGGTGEEARLSPNEMAEWNAGDGSVTVSEVDPYLYIAWRQGEFVFEEETVEEMMEELGRWYDMEVFYASERAKEMRFSGIVKRYEDLRDVLKLIESVAIVRFEVKGNTVVVAAAD